MVMIETAAHAVHKLNMQSHILHQQEYRTYKKCRAVVMSTETLDQVPAARKYCELALKDMVTKDNRASIMGLIRYCERWEIKLNDPGSVGQVKKLSHIESLAAGIRHGRNIDEVAKNIFHQMA